MDNLGENEKEILKMREEFNRQALRLVLFFVGLFLSIFILFQCEINPRWPLEVFNKVSRFIKPYTTMQFEKVNSSRPNLNLVLAKGYGVRFHSWTIAYNDKQLMVYDSLAQTNLLETHQAGGTIELVDYYQDLYSSVACQYSSGSSRFLDVYSSKTDWDIDEKKETAKSRPVLNKVSSIKFDNMKFLCFADNDSFYAVNNKTNSIEYFEGKAQTPAKSFAIGKPFISYFDYDFDFVNVNAFDGKTFYYIRKEEKVPKMVKGVIKESTGLENSHFIPVNTERFYLGNDVILDNNGKYFAIDPYDGKITCRQLLLGEDTTLKFYNIAKKHDNFYHFDERQETLTPIKIKPINLFSIFLDPNVDQETHPAYAIASGMFIDLGLDADDNDNPIVMFDYINNLYVCKTSGIDEPVTEAYISYESDMMSIYFMNNKSIYKCSVKPYTLKLRKLDLEPEPIKTIENK